jgi:hypothetical protein
MLDRANRQGGDTSRDRTSPLGKTDLYEHGVCDKRESSWDSTGRLGKADSFGHGADD